MDKELIEHITTQLQNHEENYAPGAWERFSEKEKKRGGFVFWPLWTAAAIILVLSGLFFFNNEEKINKHTIVKSKTKNTHSQSATPKRDDLIDSQIAAEEPEIILNNNESSYRAEAENTVESRSNTEGNQTPLYAANQVIDKTVTPKISTTENNTNLTSANNGVANTEVKAAQEKTKTNHNKMTFEDLLALDSKTKQGKNAQNQKNQSPKWQQDVYVAPSMGNDSKVNMNYGFSLSYAIANKLSISSGVSYASVSSTESQNASAPQSLSGRNLESVNAKVSGINVPLELRYKISEKLYTGIGVSALAVINNSQQNTYIVNQVQSMASPSFNGTTDIRSFIVAGKETEAQPESKLDPDKYIGFYNFSLGYKQKISKKNNIAIEPFLRLPMKTFSRENLNLTNGGLRLKVDF